MTQREWFYRDLGRYYASIGWPIERALTGRLQNDAWIREGYEEEQRSKREATDDL